MLLHQMRRLSRSFQRAHVMSNSIVLLDVLFVLLFSNLEDNSRSLAFIANALMMNATSNGW